MAAQGESGV
uniref:Uncharacterized protein n=1 Tax=Arundo donax TaxID=35708 RepID=A0A0A8ZAN2_ARUDO